MTTTKVPQKITLEEVREMFGDTMPWEALAVLTDEKSEPGEVRRRLTALAVIHRNQKVVAAAAAAISDELSLHKQGLDWQEPGGVIERAAKRAVSIVLAAAIKILKNPPTGLNISTFAVEGKVLADAVSGETEFLGKKDVNKLLADRIAEIGAIVD